MLLESSRLSHLCVNWCGERQPGSILHCGARLLESLMDAGGKEGTLFNVRARNKSSGAFEISSGLSPFVRVLCVGLEKMNSHHLARLTILLVNETSNGNKSSPCPTQSAIFEQRWFRDVLAALHWVH